MASNNNRNTLIISSLKIMLMSIGVLSIAILISMSMPSLLDSATYNIPSIFATFRSWLRPPYLYFIINVIIITIVASSRLHHHHHNNHQDKVATPNPPHYHQHQPPQQHHDVISLRADQFSPYGVVSAVVGPVVGDGYNYNDVVSVKDVEVEFVGKFVDNEVEFVDNNIKDDDVVIKESIIRDHDKKLTVDESSTWTPPPKASPLRRQRALEKVSPEFFSERPPASARFGHHRRPVKATQAEGGKALRVSKPKKHDTLESTWKTITEGRRIPLTRHLKKFDTWEHHDRQIDLLADSSPFPAAAKKSETFNERTNYVSPPVTTNKLKKEPSLSQDELNRRVEAFINKFNEDMRLQRQQSMQQFMEMINRAA